MARGREGAEAPAWTWWCWSKGGETQPSEGEVGSDTRQGGEREVGKWRWGRGLVRTWSRHCPEALALEACPPPRPCPKNTWPWWAVPRRLLPRSMLVLTITLPPGLTQAQLGYLILLPHQKVSHPRPALWSSPHLGAHVSPSTNLYGSPALYPGWCRVPWIMLEGIAKHRPCPCGADRTVREGRQICKGVK